MSAVAGTPINEVESKFFHRIFIGFAILATLSFAINLLGRELGSRIALGGHTEDMTMHEVIIANDVIEVPANMIRYPEQRRDGVGSGPEPVRPAHVAGAGRFVAPAVTARPAGGIEPARCTVYAAGCCV